AAWRFLDADGATLDLIECSDSFYSKTYHLIDEALETHALPRPPKAELEAYLHGDLIVKLAEDWDAAGARYPAGALLAVALEPLRQGRIDAQLLVAPQPRLAVESVETTRASVVVNLLDQVKSRLLAFDKIDGVWRERALPTPS
ncbi:S9 family peptidase, partial [Pseudomonas sp. MWU13-2625]